MWGSFLEVANNEVYVECAWTSSNAPRVQWTRRQAASQGGALSVEQGATKVVVCDPSDLGRLLCVGLQNNERRIFR